MEKSFLEKRKADIQYNLDVINEKIAESAIKSGRKPEDVYLMAVTKTVDPIFINYALDYGVKLIGENRVQEMLRKKPDLHLDNVQKHLIGHLQTNKAGQIVGEVDMIQSVDSLKIAKEIAKQSAKKGITTDVLLEINIGDEDSKSGIDIVNAYEFIHEISELKGIHVKGLMCIPPICEGDMVRKYFAQMHQLFVDIQSKKVDNVN